MFKSLVLVLPIFASVALAQLGGWHDADVNDANRDVLLRAVSSAQNYKSGVQPVCVTDITSIKSQVVSGVNYKFFVTGCVATEDGAVPMASCTAETCATPQAMQIDVFDQPWTQTLSVTNVRKLRLRA
ncbi:TPA: hypothetical protein N0F65_012490 [Lagenidium giganteum]|uniref:Cystatin domain-containing protein n=1 Tax=Lagenidium giganteum TaxID=4803 RepID=A0AAV2YT49_9STRA|nr:TPA: hypothetical protein N0F65_012490 [Lagenidium giganteum]